MNHTFTRKLGAALLAGVMMFGALPGSPARLPAAAAVESADEVGDFSIAFSGNYAKVGQPMTLEVSNAPSDDLTYNWMVDEGYVGSDPTYTPTENDLMKWIRVTVISNKETATAEMFFSELPVVYIDTEGGAPIVSKEDYIDAELTIQGNETYNSETTDLYSGATEIRGRGNSTWNQPKKPYRLKLDKKTDLLGMGKSKHWVLLANYMDESLQRNTLAYNLSGAMGMEYMKTVFVDVVLNGDFVGNYQLCENIRVDPTRVDIFDWESFAEDCAGIIAEAEGMDDDTLGDLEEYMAENMGWITSGTMSFGGMTYTISDYSEIEVPDITGGYLMELDEYYDEVSKFKTDSNQPIMFKNPEFVGTNKDMMNYVQTYIQAFENAVRSDRYTAIYDDEMLHYSDLFDMDALIDYWLINEIFFNEELNKKSTYMYKDIDGLVFMGPIWDMDWSSGGEGQTYHTEQWATKYYSTNAQANQWYKFLIQDPYFFMKAQERYWEIRDNQVADMLKELDSNYELLKNSAKANGERWGYGSEYKKYVDDLRNWFTGHLAWMDRQMATQDSLRDSLGYHPSSRLSLTLTDANGDALPADTTETAPADGITAVGQPLKLKIQGGDNTNGIAALYVNGRRVSETATRANSTTIVEVPVDSLTALPGEKNILEVQIEKPDGTINASHYVTVLATCASEDHKHSFGEWTVTTPATCTEEGVETRTCECGEKETRPVDALGHPETDSRMENKQDATCTEAGCYDSVLYCTICDVVLSRDTIIIDPLYHDYKDGVCTRCGAERNPFTDVNESDWFYDEVLWAVEKGITDGVEVDKFAPNDTCTRGQIVTFLWRAAGEPKATKTENPFTDVKESDYFYDAVLWAVEEGITDGMTETTFEPGTKCTRGQVVTFLWRANGKTAPTSTENPFEDVPESEYYYQPVLWAVEMGITDGMTDTTFEPNSTCTRGQVVTFLYRNENLG